MEAPREGRKWPEPGVLVANVASGPAGSLCLSWELEYGKVEGRGVGESFGRGHKRVGTTLSSDMCYVVPVFGQGRGCLESWG